MKKTNILYWVFTLLTAGLFVMSGISSFTAPAKAIALIVTHLGYPQYLLPFLAVAKLLAVIVILIPGFPRLKEWAYAGLIIDLSGALYSSICVGDPAKNWIFFILFYIIVFGSYIFYHKRLKAGA
jgi:uncharacterized membrane protein YphA (DoxX/SURF4 family)